MRRADRVTNSSKFLDRLDSYISNTFLEGKGNSSQTPLSYHFQLNFWDWRYVTTYWKIYVHSFLFSNSFIGTSRLKFGMKYFQKQRKKWNLIMKTWKLRQRNLRKCKWRLRTSETRPKFTRSNKNKKKYHFLVLPWSILLMCPWSGPLQAERMQAEVGDDPVLLGHDVVGQTFGLFLWERGRARVHDVTRLFRGSLGTCATKEKNTC